MSSTIKKKFGANLKHIRESFGYTQADVAKAVGINAPTLSNYERGTSEPSLTNLVKICKFYDVKLDRLIYTDVSQDLNKQSMESLKIATEFFHKIKSVV